MVGARKTALFGVCLLCVITGVHGASGDVGVIAASAIAGLLVLILFVGLVLYCFFRKGGLSLDKKKHKSKKPPRHYHNNGFYPPKYREKPHHHHSNGYATTKLPPHEPRVVRPPPPMYTYATYSGPPPEVRHPPRYQHGTVNGPPGVAIIPTQFGSVAVRPDPRPVVHKSKKYRKNHHSPSREDRGRQQPQEFVVQPSYDGIPVVRPVIYVDDPKDRDRHRHRSKSRDRKSHAKESSSNEPRVIEIKAEAPGHPPIIRPGESDPEPLSEPEPSHAVYRATSPSLTPQTRATPVRSRASSVTEAVNALRMSVQGHLDDDDDDTDSDSSSPASPRWTVDRRSTKAAPAPDPAAGDVLFFPAGQQVETERHIHAREPSPAPAPAPAPALAPSMSYDDYIYSQSLRTSRKVEPEPEKPDPVYAYSTTIRESKDLEPDVPSRASKGPAPVPPPQEPDPPVQHKDESVYAYSKVIRESTKQPRVQIVPAASQNAGYEVPAQLRQSTAARDSKYETEHGKAPTQYRDMRGSMTDRLTTLVEDGDKTRFSAYNVGAMNFGPEDNAAVAEEPVQMRHTRPRTPPVDIPRSSLIYSRSSNRPATPPNDIPLVTPRESTEIPPLNLRSSTTSPRQDYMTSGRPSTPPVDFPITPKSSVIRPRPSTPPFDAATARSAAPQEQATSSVLSETARSAAVDPATGAPGSFQARQRMIEAHLKRNAGPAEKTSSVPKTEPAKKWEPVVTAPKFEPAPAPAPSFPPGFIPPPPPPPPLPK